MQLENMEGMGKKYVVLSLFLSCVSRGPVLTRNRSLGDAFNRAEDDCMENQRSWQTTTKNNPIPTWSSYCETYMR